MPYYIMYTYDGWTEIADEFETQEETREMLAEYRMVGSGYSMRSNPTKEQLADWNRE